MGPLWGRKVWTPPPGYLLAPLLRIQLARDKFITGAKGRTSDIFDSLTFITNRNTYGPHGGNGGSESSLRQEMKGSITGIIGAVQNRGGGGVALSAIGFFYLRLLPGFVTRAYIFR